MREIFDGKERNAKTNKLGLKEIILYIEINIIRQMATDSNLQLARLNFYIIFG